MRYVFGLLMLLVASLGYPQNCSLEGARLDGLETHKPFSGEFELRLPGTWNQRGEAGDGYGIITFHGPARELIQLTYFEDAKALSLPRYARRFAKIHSQDSDDKVLKKFKVSRCIAGSVQKGIAIVATESTIRGHGTVRIEMFRIKLSKAAIVVALWAGEEQLLEWERIYALINNSAIRRAN